jgi:chromate transporter
MHQELVLRRRWISPKRFVHAMNFCMVLPGPESQQLAAYIGWLLHGTWGALTAGFLVILPSLAVMMAMAGLYVHYGQVAEVQALLYGLKPAVLAIVLTASVRLAQRVLVGRLWWAIALTTFFLLQIGASFITVVVLAGLTGWILHLFSTHPLNNLPIGLMPSHLAGEAFRSVKGSPGQMAFAGGEEGSGYAIDDHTPPPRTSQFDLNHVAGALAIAAALFSIFYGALKLYFPGMLAEMASFFIKASLLTFSGAYSVMPYVFDTLVSEKQWVTTGQLIDSIALAETTPGPLSMVNVFLGFVAAAQHTSLTALPILVAGCLGAAVAALCTFFPSFVFILAGAPWIEASRKIPAWSVPLTAISAAVVAVMIDLSLIFARYILWPTPTGDWGSIRMLDLVAGLIASLAIILMLQFRMGMVITMLICISLGVVASALGLP